MGNSCLQRTTARGEVSARGRGVSFLRAFRRLAVALFFMSALFFAAVRHASAQTQSYDAFAKEYTNELYNAVNDQVGSDVNWQTEMQQYIQQQKDGTSSTLDRLVLFCQQTAQYHGDLKDFPGYVLRQFHSLYNDLYGQQQPFPGETTVKAAVTSVANGMTGALQDQFPTLGPPSPGDTNPLGGMYNFYEQSYRQNPLGLGQLFYIPALAPETRFKTTVEHLHVTVSAGVKTTDIIFKEVREYKDNQLVLNTVIENNVKTTLFRKKQDLTILHGAVDQMRADHVNTTYIAFVQEYLNLMNYNLLKAANEDNLIIDTGNPQLTVPNGYSPDTFVQSLTGILDQMEVQQGYSG